MAADSGLLYAEGYATYLRRGGVPSTPWAWAWCLDGETVVAPPTTIEGTAFFGGGAAAAVYAPPARGTARR